jgi:Glycosyltransferase family 17
MTVWDVFPYWRERWAVDARLKLWAGVAGYRPTALLGDRTFRGDPLPVAVDLPAAEVDALVVSLDEPGAWGREKQQRDAIWRLRDEMADDDLVLVVDADEFVDPQALDRIQEATADGPVKLRMAMYVCGTRWRNPTPWRHGSACRARDLPERVTDQLRDVRTLPQVEDAGWHLTYYGTDEDIDLKLKAFSHVEVDTPQMRAALADQRENGPPGWLDDPLTGPLADILAEVPAC